MGSAECSGFIPEGSFGGISGPALKADTSGLLPLESTERTAKKPPIPKTATQITAAATSAALTPSSNWSFFRELRGSFGFLAGFCLAFTYYYNNREKTPR
jgi:hypothetical protein